jgi:hypothetical protein
MKQAEHNFGKGEVECSIHSGSTIKSCHFPTFRNLLPSTFVVEAA